MDVYDSDSDLDDQASGVSTNVLLGYASKEPTSDTISQLGGEAAWLDQSQPPSAVLAQCKICNEQMALLLQLNGELPEHFPGHERRLYIWTCRRKPCQRKPGSIRALRATRASKTEPKSQPSARTEQQQEAQSTASKSDVGAALFGAKPAATTGNPFAAGNPFSTSSTMTDGANPFSAAPAPASSLAAKSSQRTVDNDLSQTFAEKARIAAASDPKPAAKTVPFVPWPDKVTNAFARFYLDADYEWLAGDEAEESKTSAHHTAFMDVDGAEGSSGNSSKEDTMLYEDTIDKTFQRYADTLAQNPEQVLRYEFRGQPLLYSRTDAVGVQLLGPPQHASSADAKVKAVTSARGGMPRCNNCGAERVFEVQLTPHTIAELEEDSLSLGEGMEWGTIVVGVCTADCARGIDGRDASDGKTVTYAEEWAGVQWEEVVERRRK